MISSDSQANNSRYILLWGIGSIAYLFAMFQRAIPSSLSSGLVSEYQITLQQYSYFSSVYLLAYLIFQIPSGLLVDKFGPKIILRYSFIISIASSLIAIGAHTYHVTLGARFLSAAGDVLIYSSIIKVASLVSKNIYALLMALTQTIGSIGVMLATFPLESLVEKYGWRSCFWLIFSTYLVLSFTWLVIARKNVGPEIVYKRPTRLKHSEYLDLIRAMSSTLICYSSFYIVYIFIFSTWGSTYLQLGYDISSKFASAILLSGTIGLTIGGIISGILLTRTSSPQCLLYGSVFILIFICLGLAWLRNFIGNIHLNAAFVGIGMTLGICSNVITAVVRKRTSSDQISFVSAFHSVAANLVVAVLMPTLAPTSRPASHNLNLMFVIIVGAAILMFLSIYFPSKSKASR